MPVKGNRYSLTKGDQIKILDGSRLKETHVDLFYHMLRTYSQYDPQSTLVVQHIVRNPQSTHLQPIPRNVPHLQLLHSCDDLCTNCLNGHWICCYYYTTAIFIYDSLTMNFL